jgi:mRNA interferase MazF
MLKRFIEWNNLKIKLNERVILSSENKINILAKSRELWWCHIGVNIGNEQDGKNEEFERPVIILNKLSSSTYLIIPTTSKFKENKFRIRVDTLDGKFSYALIDQIKIIDARRLKRKINNIIEKDFAILKEKIYNTVINCEIPQKRDFSEPKGTVNTV